jgi:hypothetical protein
MPPLEAIEKAGRHRDSVNSAATMYVIGDSSIVL